jgi:uncharacterized protein YqgC (DUF456 family)
METLGLLLLSVGMLVGLAVIPFGLPGVAIILVSIFIYSILTGFSAGVGVFFFVVLCILTVIAETADNWLTVLGARRFGASKAAIWLSLLGGIGGAILIGGPAAALVGPFGPLVGGFAGAFLIVFGYERYRAKTTREALRAGCGTLLGRTAGILLKLVIAVSMVVAVVVSILFSTPA